MDKMLRLTTVGPELDFLRLEGLFCETANIRDKVRRLMKAGQLVGIVRGIYVTAPELQKRPASREILANMIFGPSYVSFEAVLSAAGLIPEATVAITSATPKRNRDFDTPLGRFSYRHLPLAVYRFGYRREALPDGAGYLIAHPEKALLDLLYVGGALRSLRSLGERLFEDLRLDEDAFAGLNRDRLLSYSALMPGNTFKVFLPRLVEKLHG
jgi:hypothetical protein